MTRKLDETERLIRHDRRLMETFATRRHAEHGVRRDPYCRTCETERVRG